MTPNCPFCFLTTARILHQDDLCLVIRDAYPISPGHTLIVPKRHVGSFFDATEQTVAHLHIHLIPRYEGDRDDPRGGVRWVIPEKAKYW